MAAAAQDSRERQQRRQRGPRTDIVTVPVLCASASRSQRCQACDSPSVRSSRGPRPRRGTSSRPLSFRSASRTTTCVRIYSTTQQAMRRQILTCISPHPSPAALYSLPPEPLQLSIPQSQPQRDKRFSGTVKLPNVPRPRMAICILADAADIDRAKLIELEYSSVEDLKKLNKNKKLVKKVGSGNARREVCTILIRALPSTARQEVRCLPGVRGSHQADPSSSRSRSLQGWVSTSVAPSVERARLI